MPKTERSASMSRPRKCRRVCCLPESDLFGPFGNESEEKKMIIMSVEEYEAIRLIDLEEMTQEECAIKMSVARTTIQRIYNDARKKLADALVNGQMLQIMGGDYQLCEKPSTEFGCPRCRRKRESEREETE